MAYPLSALFTLLLDHFVFWAVATFVSWYVITAFLAWYPLRHIPGPFIAKFSYLWLARNTYSGKQYLVLRDLHDKYDAPLVRLGPTLVTTNDPDILRRISGTKSPYVRDQWYTTGRFNPHEDNLISRMDTEDHAKAKAKVVPAYSGRESPAMETGVDDQVKTFINLLRTKYALPTTAAATNNDKTPLLDLGDASNYFTMDVITKLGFGKEFGYLRDGTDHYSVLSIIRSLWPFLSTSADVPWIRRVLFWPPFVTLLGPKETDKQGFGALMKIANTHVSHRLSTPPEKRPQDDMLASFIRHSLTPAECASESLLMLVAGAESSANAIRAVLVHAITCPRVYMRLKAVIREHVATFAPGKLDDGGARPITLAQAQKISYLRAVVYEGLRMRPPVLGLMSKVTPAEGDEVVPRMAGQGKSGGEVKGIKLPGGTSVAMNLSGLLRRRDVFGADAGVYRPERFEELQGEERERMERDVELVFGYGRWGCVGKTVAFMEIFKVVWEVMKNCDLQLVDPLRPCEQLSYGVFLETGLMLRVTEDRETVK